MFEGAGACATCRRGALFTNASERLHPASDSMAESASPSDASRSATKQCRTPSLKWRDRDPPPACAQGELPAHANGKREPGAGTARMTTTKAGDSIDADAST